MGRKSKAEKLRELFDEAIVDFNHCQTTLRDERLQCLQDRRFAFLAGSQWEGPLGLQFANKPRLEVNKVAVALDQIETDYLNNRIDVSFESKDGAPNDELAEACAQLYRADVQDSGAEEAYDNAATDARTGGFGAWELCAEYEDEDADEAIDLDDDGNYPDEDRPQRVRFRVIVDADSSVFFDPNAKRQDKSDARYCFVTTALTHAEYEREFPDSDLASLQKQIHQLEFDWCTPKVIYVASLYRVERQRDIVYTYRDSLGQEERLLKSDMDEDPSLEEDLISTGYQRVRQTAIKFKRVRKFIMNGTEILEDCGFIAGREIPVVPVYGKRVFIDNVERCRGHVRFAKDPQRVKNMQLSKLAEISAYSTLEKPIFAPEQVLGLENGWSTDNVDPKPFALARPLTDAMGQIVQAGPTGFTKVPSVPQAMALLLQMVDIDTKEVLGNPDQGEKIVSHTSGRAVEATQMRLDDKSFPYTSNMAKAIRRSGQIWLSMQRDLYTQPGRKMKGLTAQSKRTSVELMRPVADPKTGQITYQNDMRRAVFDVAVNVGPSSISKRDAAVRTAIDMLAVAGDPETQAVLSAFIMSQMQGEGVEDLHAYARKKLLSLGAAKPTPEEAKAREEEAAKAKPTPMDEYLKAETAESLANADQTKLESMRILAQTRKLEAETVSTMAAVDRDREASAIDAAQTVHDILTPAPGANGNG